MAHPWASADAVVPPDLRVEKVYAAINTLTSNRILDALPSAYRSSLLPRLEPVTLPIPNMLYLSRETPRYAHFLTSGIASFVTLMEDGRALELGVVGPEGLVEVAHLLGGAGVTSEALMQIEGTALRMPFSELKREFMTSEPLRCLILEFVQEQTLIANQLAACNYFHSVRERLCRWLLMIQDRLNQPEFHLTQAFLADMIGVQRPTVTLIAGELQRGGLIEYWRGNIRIRDRAGLIASACECYRVIANLRQHPSRSPE